MLLYWGRRGGLARFALDAATAAGEEPGLEATISVSRQNERFEDFAGFGPALHPVSTFASPLGAIAGLATIPLLRRDLDRRLREDRIVSAVTLLSHVFSPFVASVFRQAGVRHSIIVHDADPHPGDRTGLLQGWYQRGIAEADRIVTLSRTVTERLVTAHAIPEEKILTLFHPDFSPSRSLPVLPAPPTAPFRLLFLGRIMPYKGLGLFIDAVDRLRRRGVDIAAGVYGEGDLEPHCADLRRIGATVVNRWLGDDEIDAVLADHHALVLSHIEASQSGVAALGLGRGLPLIATPVGGLTEQIVDGETGILARAADAAALAEAIERLAGDPALYRHLREGIALRAEPCSMRSFMAALADDMRAGAAG